MLNVYYVLRTCVFLRSVCFLCGPYCYNANKHDLCCLVCKILKMSSIYITRLSPCLTASDRVRDEGGGGPDTVLSRLPANRRPQ